LFETVEVSVNSLSPLLAHEAEAYPLALPQEANEVILQQVEFDCYSRLRECLAVKCQELGDGL
jgi:hypothetical protein